MASVHVWDRGFIPGEEAKAPRADSEPCCPINLCQPSDHFELLDVIWRLSKLCHSEPLLAKNLPENLPASLSGRGLFTKAVAEKPAECK
jgi:hypothetical protein